MTSLKTNAAFSERRLTAATFTLYYKLPNKSSSFFWSICNTFLCKL